jgi:hypothetical protein
MSISTEVWCTLQFEATHNWPGCPFDEVDYLRVPHRHIFHIKAYAAVTHSDRDVEFIMLKHSIQGYLEATYPDHKLGAMSCEMLGRELLEKFGLTRCEVSEDLENGAIVTQHRIT